MSTVRVPEPLTIARSLASLYDLMDTRGHDPTSRSALASPQAMAALQQRFAEEYERLTASAEASLTMAQRVLRALKLHLLFYEVKLFVESDTGGLIASLLTQAETFMQRYRQDEPITASRSTAIIASLQKQFRVKSHRLHQLPCSPATTTKRVELIKEHLTPTSRILCLGDDDFVSVALALAVPNEITALDLDPQVITMIEQVAQQHHLRIACQRADIRKPLPDHFYAAYDVVVTDPIYSVQEMLLFLSVAESCLRKSADSYLLSCGSRPMAGAAWSRVEEWAASRGLVIHEFLSGFNEYPKTARTQTALNLAERLFCHSSLTRACVGIPFVYSDLVVFRFDVNKKGNKL